MASHTSTATVVVTGHTVAIGSPPNSTAFDVVFGAGVALTVVVILLSSVSKNYTFREMAKPPPRPQE